MLGGGRLRLVKANHVREPFSTAKVESLGSFLEAQPYVTGVEHGVTATGLYLDEFRGCATSQQATAGSCAA
jgi:hypothetical protein